MSLILRPGDTIPPRGTPPNPFKIQVDPQNHSSARVLHEPSGSEVIFTESGIVGIRSAFGTIMQMAPDGSFEIHAARLRLILDEPDIQIIDRQEVVKALSGGSTPHEDDRR